MAPCRLDRPFISARLKRAADAVARGVAHDARSRLADALPGLPRAGRGQRPLPGVLVETVLHHPALLRAARHSFRVRPGSGHPVDGSDRRPAGLSPRPRRRAFRRDFARAGACSQIWRPARSGADDGALDQPCRARNPCRGRCAGAGAAALAAAVGAALQPIGHARGHRFRRKAACRSLPARSSASRRPRSRSG